MPDLTVVVAGTQTGVGKTWTTAAAVRALRARGVPVHVRKPVQSYDPADGMTDAEVLARASGCDPSEVCPLHRWYPLAMAPPMAADELGRPAIHLRDLIDELEAPGAGVLLVEGVGGPRSPVAHDADTVTLARAVGADLVVVVAGAGLGAINAVELAAPTFTGALVTVFLNRFALTDTVHALNRAWLSQRGFDVVVSIADLCARLNTALGSLEESTT